MNYQEILDLTKWLEKSAFTAYSLSINGVHLSITKQQSSQHTHHHYNPHQSTTTDYLSTTNQPMGVTQPGLNFTPMSTPSQLSETNNVNETMENMNSQTNYHLITSPIVATYYESSSPESEALAKVGQKVKKGDVLCILEAMKIMNEIVSDVDGVVVEIFASNGDMVEARMPLFRIEVQA